MHGASDRSLARDIVLFAVLVYLVIGLIVPGAPSASDLMTTFYLTLFVHVGFTLYDGSFSALRTATWLMLIATWAGSEIVTFLANALPFWKTTVPVVGEILAAWLRSGAALVPEASVPWAVLSLLILGIDIAAMHHDRWRGSSLLHKAIFLASDGVVAIVLGLALYLAMGSAPGGADPGITPFLIVPPWHTLPVYALLRAVPSKLGGWALMLAAMVMPMIWPWMRADALRRGRTRWVWSLLCLALAAAWIGLGFFGSRPPDDVAGAVWALAVFYFVFFLVLPPVLRKIAGGAAAA